MSIDFDYFSKLLLDLSYRIKEIIDTDLNDKTILPENRLFKTKIISDFNYDNHGFPTFRFHYQDDVKLIWYTAKSHIHNIIRETDEVKKIVEFFLAYDKKFITDDRLGGFISKLIEIRLNNDSQYEVVANRLIQIYLKELKGEPIYYYTTVKLQGIVLKPERIEISDTIILRKPTPDDFSTSIEEGYYLPEDSDWRKPSAFLDITVKALYVRSLQEEVKKAIFILRLYQLGDIDFINYTLNSESLSRYHIGRISTSDRGAPYKIYTITQQDVRLLRLFWGAIYNKINRSIYDERAKEIDFISTAYQHYSDSITIFGPPEKQIAYAIMGLESLFFKSKERSELSYRLSLRIAKFFSYLDQDTLKTRKMIKDAYEIRSTFFHGSQLEKDELEKYQKRYDMNLEKIKLFIQNSLRISIILYLTIDMSKESFLSSLEDSLIMDGDEIRKKIEPCKKFWNVLSGSN